MNTSTGPRRLGKYELREILGHGGMAEVWKAFDTHLQRYVAIKILHADLQNDPHFMARFEREARVVAPLHHRNIVQIHDFQVARPLESASLIAYMVMDYIEGPTLADYIARTAGAKKFPPVSDIIHVFASIGSAIDYAHQQGVVHRDIKPANILLDQRNRSRSPIGEPMLTDFGIAKLLGSSTSLGSKLWPGTESYISPEQAQGYVGNERSDLYALGIILYEICTGARPFQGDTPTAIVMQHITTTPASPVLLNPNIPPALAMVILRALAKDPGARFTSASAMAVAIAEAFNMPVPEELSHPTPLPDMTNEPTLYRQPQFDVPSSVTPSSPVPPIYGSSSLASLPSVVLTPPSLPASVSSTYGTRQLTPGAFPTDSSARDTSLPELAVTLTPPSPVLTPFPTAMPGPRRRRNNRLVVLIAVLLLLLLVGSGVGVYFLLFHQGTVPAVTAGPIVGHAFFVSSGQLEEGSSLGINDELKINLQNIPTPGIGRRYYAWLLGDKICDHDSTNPDLNLHCDPNDPKHQRILHPLAPIFLGALSVIDGHIQILYGGDQQHTNLLGITSRLLITEENANTTPNSPSTDLHTWRYYAEIPQIPDHSALHHTALHTLRNLLYEGETLGTRGIHGGSDIRLLRNTEKVLEWASSAREAWGANPGLLHRQVIRILDYLDGVLLVKEDVPPHTPILVDPKLAYVPLIDLHKIQVSHSYFHRMDVNLSALPHQSVTPAIARLAIAANEALLHNANTFLQQVHKDAMQLIKMTDAQLAQPAALSILDDMHTMANYALIGRLDPSTDKLQDGVIQVHYIIQGLATFDVRPYTLS